MSRSYDNWERLVRATLTREQLRAAVQGHERTTSGIAGAVPPSLVRTTNIDAILQAADEIQDDDLVVARILCEQAYSIAQNLDPNSDGRGVLQFKTGLMSVIKQKLAKREGAQIDRSRDIEHLWEFYQRYKRRHRVDDIQREERKLRESGTFTTANLGDAHCYNECNENLEAPSITNAIVPLEAPSITNAIGVFPEVRGAISANILSTSQDFLLIWTFLVIGMQTCLIFWNMCLDFRKTT